MQKFPLRMKDNDLLVTELFRDPAGDSITALSVYLSPKIGTLALLKSTMACNSTICDILNVFCSGVNGNWFEIAYGTRSGAVRVIVQHPETVGSIPQPFQTFTVHTNPVNKVALSEKLLVSGEFQLLLV